MGGSSSKKSTTKKEEPAPAPAPTVTHPAFMPGFDSMIAQQLSQGGYGDTASLLASFQPIFTNMQLPGTSTPAPASPTPSTPSPSAGGGNPLNAMFPDLKQVGGGYYFERGPGTPEGNRDRAFYPNNGLPHGANRR